ncbi:transmembrane protein 221 [Corythoichthys intestinalis]|uniref:transmembrane protein 221 n=1 Tax=Corythoichthys intestinalis TaxID=161448 RepID=UPI0025A5C159|nr:transmembrane protein 221 [Corythoichthys intestinalis]XP_061790845.1 transmembrane protein 221-like [Nerophis lumbriciformis]
MSNSYSQRSVVVLSLLGILSAIMSVLSVILIFQLQPQHTAMKEDATSVVPPHVRPFLSPVSTILSALSLTLNLSSVVVCLLHGYFSTEVCRGEQDTERADWFLVDSRAVRHLAIGLFCLGVSIYLAAMSIFMLLIFEAETGIASACVLASGIFILLVVVIHSLVKFSRVAKRGQDDHLENLFRSELRSSNDSPVSWPCELKIGVDKLRVPRRLSHFQHHMSLTPSSSPRHQQQHHLQEDYAPVVEELQGHSSNTDGYSGGDSAPRSHRSLSSDSVLHKSKPWNGVNNEMRSVLARKSLNPAKDSTLV